MRSVFSRPGTFVYSGANRVEQPRSGGFGPSPGRSSPLLPVAVAPSLVCHWWVALAQSRTDHKLCTCVQ